MAWREARLISHMKRWATLAEKTYDEMYETSSTTGLYSEVKELFLEAIQIAGELEFAKEREELTRRLEHIKNVYRRQF